MQQSRKGSRPANETVGRDDRVMVTLVGHEDADGRLLMFKLQAADVEPGDDVALNVALVLDASGSMAGEKLRLARMAAARFVRSLRPQDRACVVSYDHEVTLVAPPAKPSEGMAKLIERIASGGSTNLHGGWLTGARALPAGGRVILLSDGLANVGELTGAEAMGAAAGDFYRSHEVVTSTIGVGNDYDEHLMGAMASQGGGGHYFAHSPDAIAEAFSQERFAMSAVALDRVRLVLDGVEQPLGSLFSGEQRAGVFRMLKVPKTASLRYATAEGVEVELALKAPKKLAVSHEATAEALTAQASDFEGRAISVRSREVAQAAAAEARGLLLAVMNHPLASRPRLATVVSLLERSLDRLDRLARRYDEAFASEHRKRGVQMSRNIAESGKSFSSFADDRSMIHASRAGAFAPSEWAVEPKAFDLLPVEEWLRLGAAPCRVTAKRVEIVIENPLDGFLASEVSKAVGRAVRVRMQPATREEIETAIRAAEPDTWFLPNEEDFIEWARAKADELK